MEVEWKTGNKAGKGEGLASTGHHRDHKEFAKVSIQFFYILYPISLVPKITLLDNATTLWPDLSVFGSVSFVRLFGQS